MLSVVRNTLAQCPAPARHAWAGHPPGSRPFPPTRSWSIPPAIVREALGSVGSSFGSVDRFASIVRPTRKPCQLPPLWPMPFAFPVCSAYKIRSATSAFDSIGTRCSCHWLPPALDTHTHTHSHAQTQTQRRTHTHTHTQTHAHSDTCTHATPSCPPRSWGSCPRRRARGPTGVPTRCVPGLVSPTARGRAHRTARKCTRAVEHAAVRACTRCPCSALLKCSKIIWDVNLAALSGCQQPQNGKLLGQLTTA